MRRHISIVISIVLVVGLLETVIAQDLPLNLTAQNARIFRASGGAFLTAPTEQGVTEVATDFLGSRGHNPATLGSLVVVSEHHPENSGQTHLRLAQEIDGLRIYGTYVKATFSERGQLVHLIENLAEPTGLLPATVDFRDALQAALRIHFPALGFSLFEDDVSGNTVVFSQDPFFHRRPTVTRVAVAMRSGLLEEGYLVETWTQQENLLYHTLVGGSGRVLAFELRTNTDSYNIFADHPDNSTQTVEPGPGASNAESPSGWLSGSQTTVDISGNNVHAYLDRDANNVPDGGGSAVGDGNFLTSANLDADPTTTQNQEVAVQNLFYFNNVIHDKLYRHGFIESAGNFQENNFGNGGDGSDAVNAEAQDGGGTNNANFATPSDGSNPRMQMFLWTQTNPRRDGDLDSDIIWHEYGHGLTWRMIGSMSGPMSGAIGEGMSDVLAILINNNDVVGEYSYNNPFGIRSAPYTNYPRTYGDFSGNSVHFDGEIYAATIWRLWELFQAENISQDDLFDYLIGGMNFTPSGPSMEDMRDGILQAANGSGNECVIWEAFADYGIGAGAKGQVKGGGPFGGGRVSVTESFDLPAECSSNPTEPPTGPGIVMHIGDLDDSSSAASSGRWNASVVLLVHDESDNPVQGASVTGNWTSGANGSGSCTTDSNGQCSIGKNNIKSNVRSVTFAVTDVTRSSGDSYSSSSNHDPDGDSNGTTITVSQP